MHKCLKDLIPNVDGAPRVVGGVGPDRFL